MIGQAPGRCDGRRWGSPRWRNDPCFASGKSATCLVTAAALLSMRAPVTFLLLHWASADFGIGCWRAPAFANRSAAAVVM